MLMGIFAVVPSHLPSRPYSTVLTDSSGREIAEVVHGESIRHRPVDSRTVPGFLAEAMIAIEDRHYYRHLGVSLRGIGRAVARGIEDGSISE